MAYHFRNLVFEGGAVKGVAYIGAMQVLKSKGILKDIVRIGGTSAGAINALLFGLNYSPEETKDILFKLDFNNFLDDSWFFLCNIKRLVNNFGWHKGNYFHSWISNLIKEKTGNPGSTFKEVKDQKQNSNFKDMYFISTNLSTGFAEVFSSEHTPQMRIADAVRMSMSIPLFFKAKRLDRGDVCIDGGVLDNYPIRLFDRQIYVEKYSITRDYYDEQNIELRPAKPYVLNKETLGFRLDSLKEIAVFRHHAALEYREIKDFSAFAFSLIKTVMGNQDSRHLHSNDWQRTIYIDTLGVNSTAFDIDDTKKEALVGSGIKYTNKYFDEWFDNPVKKPINRA